MVRIGKKKEGLSPSRIFLLVFTCISLSIFIVSSMLYFNCRKNISGKIFNSEKGNLLQASYSARQMTETSKTLALQVYYSNEITNLRSLENLDTVDYNRAFNSMRNYIDTFTQISSIYIYNAKANAIYAYSQENTRTYTPDEFYDLGAVTIIRNYKEYKKLYPITRKIPSRFVNDKNPLFLGGYSFLYYEQSSNTELLANAIIVNISETWLQDIMEQISPTATGDTFVIDKAGRMMVSTPSRSISEDVSKLTYVNTILTKKEKSGYFTDRSDGVEKLVIYVHYEPLDWIFVRCIPSMQLMKEINAMQQVTLVTAFLILLLGIMIAFILSKHLHKPYKAIEARLRILESEKRDSRHALKEELLRSILAGSNEHSQENMPARMESLGIRLNPNGYYVLVYARIDHYAQLTAKYDGNDMKLLKFAALNIFSEHFSHFFKTEGVDMLDDAMVLILNLSLEEADNGSLFARIREKCDESKNSVLHFLDIPISVSVSTVNRSESELKALYDEVRHFSQYRLYFGHQCTIFPENISFRSLNEYKYPAKEEKTLLEALLLGKLDEVRSAYTRMIENTRDFPIEAFHLMLSHLAVSIMSAAEAIESNNRSCFYFNFGEFLSSINKCETLDEVNQLFDQLFESILSRMDEKKTAKYEDLLQKVMEIVNARYMDQNLSIESIALQLDMSHVYLGRLIKKLLSKSIVDYIHEVRISKAWEFLENTSLPIQEIVEKTGYTNVQYFYKMFKKTYGITPGEMRQNLIMGRK